MSGDYEWNSCGRKNSYWTYDDAQVEAAKWWRKEKKILEVYSCNFCYCYHLTKKLYEKKESRR